MIGIKFLAQNLENSNWCCYLSTKESTFNIDPKILLTHLTNLLAPSHTQIKENSISF